MIDVCGKLQTDVDWLGCYSSDVPVLHVVSQNCNFQQSQVILSQFHPQHGSYCLASELRELWQ